jgi:threonine/homoserine/homoserine lactone efflux protein
MEIAFCLKGIAVGFILCAPLGPVGVLCLQRTLTAGRLAGFFSILGAALIDGCYGLMAGAGMSALGSLLDAGRCWLQLFGGVVLVVVGIRLCRASAGVAARSEPCPVRSSLDAFLSTAALMLSNPLPILVISAALSAIGRGGIRMGFMDIPLFALGLFLGSLLWSPILVGASSLISPMLRPRHLRLVNRACGAIIAGCGLLLGVAPLVGSSM